MPQLFQNLAREEHSIEPPEKLTYGDHDKQWESNIVNTNTETTKPLVAIRELQETLSSVTVNK